MKHFAFIVFTLLFLSQFLFAQEMAARANQSVAAAVMKMQYASAACSIDFYLGVLNDVKNQGTGISTQTVSLSLENHKADLENAANSGDRDAFNVAASLLEEDSRNTAAIYNDFKHALLGKENTISRIIQRAFFEERSKNKASCLEPLVNEMGEAELAYANAWIENAKNISVRISEKGINSSGMDTVIAQANKKVSRLKYALSTKDAPGILQAAKEVNGEYPYIWARFHLARLQSLLLAIDAHADAKGFAAQSDSIKSLLAATGKEVRAGKAYDENEFESARNNLSQAAKELRQLVADIQK